MDKDPLNTKQRIFVNEYIVDFNATQAAIRAGYSENGAESKGSQLLSNVKVSAEVDKALAKRQKRVTVTQDDVIRELRMIAFSDMDDYVEWGPDGVTLKPKEERGTGRLISEVKETVTKGGSRQHLKLHSKTKALEMLGKHLGMYTDRHEVVSEAGITINLVEAKPPAEDSSGEGS